MTVRLWQITCFVTFFFAISASSNAADYFAGEFLAVGTSPSAMGVGGAVVASAEGTEAVYWNPAGLAGSRVMTTAFEHAEAFGGMVNHDVAAFSAPMRNAGFGILLLRSGVDGIIRADSTILADPTKPLGYDNMPDPSKITTFSNADYTLHLAYARRVSGSIRAGVTLKLITRSIDDTDAFGYGLDAGAQWDISQSFAMGLTVRDLTTTRVQWDNDRNDIVKPTVNIAADHSRDLISNTLSMRISLGVVLGAESAGYGGFLPWNVVRSESPAVAGAELSWRDMIFLRLGTRHIRGLLGPGDSHLTAGAGFHIGTPWLSGVSRIGFDLAWMKHSLDDTFRLGAVVEL